MEREKLSSRLGFILISAVRSGSEMFGNFHMWLAKMVGLSLF